MSTEHCEIGGRCVKIVTGTKSQTINIRFEDEPQDGKYEHRFRIAQKGQFVTAEGLTLEGFESLTHFLTWLEQLASRESGTLPNSPPIPTEPDRNWGNLQKHKLDAAVNNLLEEFVSFPYRHRVEHSLHCDLFHRLLEIPEIGNGRIQVGGSHNTRLVHKEWPETKKREDKSGRGNFDLAVLTPSDATPGVTEDWFLGGYIKPYAAFELGLDYDYDHFFQDVQKLHNSEICCGYVIHFARPNACDQQHVVDYVNGLIERDHDGEDHWPSLAVVIMDHPRSFRVKKIGDKEFKTRVVSDSGA